MIEIRDLKKIYVMGENQVHALRDISLRIEDGDFVAIMGPSGSGKSTLAHILGLLDVPTEGSYRLGGREVSQLGEDQLALLRREEIGFVFQQFNLLPRMSALENVALPLFYSQKGGKSGATTAMKLLESVGLGPRVGHQPNELSGGQQQRVAIARSLVNAPRMILADEPTGNLDSESEKDIMSALKELNAQGITIVLVTHEEEIGAQAKRLIRMRDGAIQSDERRAPLHATGTRPESKTLATHPLSEPGRAGAAQLSAHFAQGFKTLAANKIRTGLSMLGILIGVAAVVAMLALGRGAQSAIESQLSSLGSNLLVLRSGAQRVAGVALESGANTRLTIEDSAAIQEQVFGVKSVSGSVQGRGQIAFGNKNWSSQVQGVSATYAAMHASQPETGRFFDNEENSRRTRVAVIGATVADELFGDQSPLGEMIKINRTNFQVIGVLPEKGGSGFRNQDDVVLIPILTAMHRLFGKEYLDSIELEIQDAKTIEDAQGQILGLMYNRKKVPLSQQEDAFQILNLADIQQALSQSSKTMAALLASIAAISLLVGGIGIMNIMLVSVTERTKEIGLRKAIGATRGDILLQFLAESVVVSAVGGLLGVLLGWLITTTLSFFTGWATSISMDSVLLALFFSAFIGIIFGIYPARKASRLHPIDALRYE